MNDPRYSPRELERMAAILAGTEWDPRTVPAAVVASEALDDSQTIGSMGGRPDAAAWCAWEVLTHRADYASQIHALSELARIGPDAWAFVWEIVREAAVLGYRFAQLPVRDEMRNEEAVRLLAGITGVPLLPDPVEMDTESDAA